jgi:hypothetical protein
MSKAEVFAGICGFHTIIEAVSEEDKVKLTMQSDCAAIQRLAAQLTEVDPFQEITFRRGGPLTLQMGMKYCSHTACPVPVGIIKAIEVEAGLALPADVTIKVSRSPAE